MLMPEGRAQRYLKVLSLSRNLAIERSTHRGVVELSLGGLHHQYPKVNVTSDPLQETQDELATAQGEHQLTYRIDPQVVRATYAD
jgi:hypothetical protein